MRFKRVAYIPEIGDRVDYTSSNGKSRSGVIQSVDAKRQLVTIKKQSPSRFSSKIKVTPFSNVSLNSFISSPLPVIFRPANSAPELIEMAQIVDSSTLSKENFLEIIRQHESLGEPIIRPTIMGSISPVISQSRPVYTGDPGARTYERFNNPSEEDSDNTSNCHVC